MHAKIASLTYDAEKERLTGTIGHEKFDLAAYSGGSRGHKPIDKHDKKTAVTYRYAEANSMFSRFANTATIGEGTSKDPYKQRGGTLPPGHYSCTYIQHHKAFGECVYLKRDADTRIHYPTLTGVSLDNRGDDFYIHGSGPKGSDGCIVIPDKTERHRVNAAIRDFSRNGHVILRVIHVAYLLPAEGGNVAIV
jgi:hypothetical protein